MESWRDVEEIERCVSIAIMNSEKFCGVGTRQDSMMHFTLTGNECVRLNVCMTAFLHTLCLYALNMDYDSLNHWCVF